MARFDAGNESEMVGVLAEPVEINGLGDVTPVYCHQSHAIRLYKGKYKRACWKFEVRTTNAGAPFLRRPKGLSEREQCGSEEEETDGERE